MVSLKDKLAAKSLLEAEIVKVEDKIQELEGAKKVKITKKLKK